MIEQKLKDLRKKFGISQAELAKQINVSSGNVGDWERGKSKPAFDAIVALAKYFEVSTDFLLLDKDTDNKGYSLEQLTEYEKQIIYKCRSGANIIFDDDLTIESGLINGLSKKESNIILKYRALDERNKEELEDILNLKYDRVLQQKISDENKGTSSILTNGKGNMVG